MSRESRALPSEATPKTDAWERALQFKGKGEARWANAYHDLMLHARELERDLERLQSAHAECVVAMVPFIPAFGYLRDAIKELGKRAEGSENAPASNLRLPPLMSEEDLALTERLIERVRQGDGLTEAERIGAAEVMTAAVLLKRLDRLNRLGKGDRP